MTDNGSADIELERFVRDWHWDKKSHRYAQELGRFLLVFLDDLETSGLSRATLTKHRDNCWLIGTFECKCGGYGKFLVGRVFDIPEAAHELEFARKVSDSEYALQSYRSTWRKIHKYARRRGLVE